MTSVEIRKKFFVCRWIQAERCRPSWMRKAEPFEFIGQSFKWQRNERVCVSQRLVNELLSVCCALSGGASGWWCGLNVRLSQGFGDSDVPGHTFSSLPWEDHVCPQLRPRRLNVQATTHAGRPCHHFWQADRLASIGHRWGRCCWWCSGILLAGRRISVSSISTARSGSQRLHNFGCAERCFKLRRTSASSAEIEPSHGQDRHTCVITPCPWLFRQSAVHQEDRLLPRSGV